MRIAGGSSVGYHPNTGIKLSHSSVSRMRQDKGQTTLFSPKAFRVSMSGNSGVGVVKVGDDKTVSKAKSV